jgi:hypothetical protein
MSEAPRVLSALKYEFVILSKVDKEGSCNLLHTKPLHAEFVYQQPDSILTFSEDKKIPLFKYLICRESEFAKLGASKLIINTKSDHICLQFAKESGSFLQLLLYTSKTEFFNFFIHIFYRKGRVSGEAARDQKRPQGLAF